MNRFPLKHVYESQQFDREILDTLFVVADDIKDDLGRGEPCRYRLDGKLMASLFYEPSTRTRFSFESAMKRLGGDILTTENAETFSSAAKGETIEDTARIMAGYVDAIVLRHYAAGSAERAARISPIPVVNAGDGAGQHPTQALLDLYTLKDCFGRIDGLRIAMVGDLKYGRTVRSLCYLLTKYDNVKICFVSPTVCRMEEDIKEYLDRYGVPWCEETELDRVLTDVDCVYMTRIQKERFVVPEEYEEAAGAFILTPEKVQTMQPEAIIMHPLPRVDEIPPEVDDDPRAKYFEQAKNGLFIRMALLYLLMKR